MDYEDQEDYRDYVVKSCTNLAAFNCIISKIMVIPVYLGYEYIDIVNKYPVVHKWTYLMDTVELPAK